MKARIYPLPNNGRKAWGLLYEANGVTHDLVFNYQEDAAAYCRSRGIDYTIAE